MVDIHHHLLWGVDDGAKDFEMSVAMAKASVAGGVTHVVCTPHANGVYPYEPSANREKVKRLQACLDEQTVPLKVGLGCDFHINYDNVVEAKETPARFSVNGHQYLMVEIPDYGLPQGLSETFHDLQQIGLRPILTHPERNPSLQSDYTKLAEWLRNGILIQVTGDSVTGKMGKSAEKMAHALLARRWVHFIATDAHNVSSRPPRLEEARRLIAKKYGESYAADLSERHPLAVFEGRPFEPGEESKGLYEEYVEKSWWQRLMD